MGDNECVVGVVLNPNAGHFRTKKGQKEYKNLIGWHNRHIGTLQEKYGDKIVVCAKAKPEDVQYTCDEFLEKEVRLVLTVGGDGTQGNIYTNMARRVWLRSKNKLEDVVERLKNPDEKEMVSYMKRINTEKGPIIPYFYNVKGGTVHVFSNMIRATSNLELALDNTFKAFEEGFGFESFKRAFIPTIIAYSSEEPENPARMEVMFEYADGGLRKFYDEYYKDKGPGRPNRTTAYALILKALRSIPIPNGFVHQLGRKIPSTVTIDGEELPIQQRTTLVASTINGSLYGLRPFYRMPNDFQDFARHYQERQPTEIPEDAVQRAFHVLTGDVDAWRIVTAAPRMAAGKPSGIKNIHDQTAQEVIIGQNSRVLYIADGTRKEEGKKLVLTSGFEIGVPYLHEEPVLRSN